VPEVPIEKLRPACDPDSFSFQTTADIEPHVGLIGQDRAIEAIKFGISIESQGFNIVVSGEPGTGRTTAIRQYLEAVAGTRPPPDEWLYVNNFADPYRPKALRLPPGRGRAFQNAMTDMIGEAHELIPRTFSSDDFTARRDQIITSVQRQRQELFAQLTNQAREAGFQLQGNPQGFFLIPLKEGQPMDDQSFSALSQEERAGILKKRDELMAQLRPQTRHGQSEESEAQARLKELEHTIGQNTIDMLVQRFFEDYEDFPEVIQYILEVRRDMIDNFRLFLPQESPPAPVPGPVRDANLPFRKYEVNLLVDCSAEECSPVLFESNPTPQNLFGRIEKEAVFGAVTTDFTMIRPGTMHRSNGGYLVFDFDDVLLYPLSWNEMKRTIRTGHINIEELGDRLGFIETKTIRPEPIPWSGKIVGIAREGVYRALYSLDPDFRELFKVKASFDMRIDRTSENERAYAGLIAGVAKRENLPPLDRGAVARLVEEGMRMADDHTKLSILFGTISDIVREAAHLARQEESPVITASHVSRSVRQRHERVNLIEENMREAISREIVLVQTEGEAVGQVNGLSVVDLGDTRFGQPSRITATVGVGREGIVDLQREARMSGPIHSKAVLTLQGFLVDRYAAETPVTLAARLSFEQNYGLIEGDSATCAEVCALLSRLADVPVKQSLAITGSMDQRGEVQAIGGANQKIEGFYDVCRERGLTGDQGVIVPESNIQHLMLREDVVEAVRDGRFKVYSVSNIDEALELLTGLHPGSKQEDGLYDPDSINGRVLARLRAFAERLYEFSDAHSRHFALPPPDQEP
jgi:lon-related putative ATP-dependent protease